MSTSLYSDPLQPPNTDQFLKDLGGSSIFLEGIKSFLKAYGKVNTEWKCYSKKSGWILKVHIGKRNILFVIPQKESLRVTFTFGEKAVQKIIESDLPLAIKEETEKVRQYAEGRSIQWNVNSAIELESIFKLIQIKLN